MKKKKNPEADADIRYGADTSDCSAECMQERIRLRAYQLFESQGRQPGRDLEHWLQAELEFKQYS